MPSKRVTTLISFLPLIVLGMSLFARGQNTSSTTIESLQTVAVVPRLVRFSGTIKDASGKPVSGVAGVTFALYKDREGGAALWIETQNVQFDAAGHYTVMLGASKSDGLPTGVFTSGEARWLGVTPAGENEQARVLLLSVPYALKAADAETLGGKPASAYALAAQEKTDATTPVPEAGNTPPPAPPTVHGSGTPNHLPLWTGTSLLGNSALFQSGANVGIGTTAPATALDVNGSATIRGNQNVTGTLTTNGSLTAPSGSFTGNNPTSVVSVTQNGTGAGLSATTANKTGSFGAVNGTATATSGQGIGVIGATSSNSGGIGVMGSAGTFGGIGKSTGVYGIAWNSTGTGVSGIGSIGVEGDTGFSTGFGVHGVNSGGGMGVYGVATGSTGQGVWGESFAPNFGPSVGADGVHGIAHSKNGSGVAGANVAEGGTGMYGAGGGGSSAGATGGPGIQAYGGAETGLSSTGGVGVIANGGNTAPDGGNAGGNGLEATGGTGYGDSGGIGVVAQGGPAGIFGIDGDGIDAYPGGSGAYAGYFVGDINVSGAIFAGTKDFKVDHPLDPANKYLYHTSVESSEMKNIYDGVVTLDASGEATIHLPEWFQALNTNFRYQLTGIGGFAPIYIASEMANNQFRIAGGKSGMKVSWQVTGVRHDAYAQAHPLQVETEKPDRERGFYIHPELFGASEEKAIDWARHPETMKHMKDVRAKQALQPKNP